MKFLFPAAVFHLLMLISLLSEPMYLEHGIHLTGTHSHPQEKAEYRGFLDSFFHDTDRVPRGLDYFSIYQSGRNFLNGTSVYYGVRVHRLGDNALVVPYFSGFRYLPVYACTFGVLLNLLPPWQSYWAWIFLVELLLLFNISLLRYLPLSTNNKTLLAALWLGYSPYYIELHIGQQSMITVTLLHLAIIFHVTNNRRLRELSYVASVLWKINTILFIPIWLKLKKFKTILLLFVLTIVFSFPYFFLVEGSFQEFISYFHHKFIAIGPNSLGFWSLAATILQRAEISHHSIRSILGIWTIGILSIASLATLIPRRINFLSALGMWICVYFLTYQYVWEHHYVMLLPVFTIVLLVRGLRIPGIIAWFFCALPTPYIFFNLPGTMMPQMKWTFLQDIFYHSTKILPVAVLFCLFIADLIKNRNADSQVDNHESQLDLLKPFR